MGTYPLSVAARSTRGLLHHLGKKGRVLRATLPEPRRTAGVAGDRAQNPRRRARRARCLELGARGARHLGTGGENRCDGVGWIDLHQPRLFFFFFVCLFFFFLFFFFFFFF